MSGLDNLDKALIDKYFHGQELARSWGPSGIYLKVQKYIDDGLQEDRTRHDAECEHRAGNPYNCRCQERRGCDYEDLDEIDWAERRSGLR